MKKSIFVVLALIFAFSSVAFAGIENDTLVVADMYDATTAGPNSA